MILVTKTSDQEGTHSIYLYNSYLSPEYLVLPPLLPCYSLDYLGWQLLNQPFLFYFFFSFRPCLPRFPHGVYNYFAVSCALSPLFRHPDPTLVPLIVVPVPISATVLASVPVPVPVPIQCSSTGPRPRPRSRSRPVLLRSPPPPFPFPLRLHPHDRSRPRYRLRSRPRLQSRPRPRSLLPFPRTRLPPRYDALVPTPGLAHGAAGCSQAPPPVCRDGDACEMRGPPVKQKRIAAEDVLLLSLPPDVGTHWSMSPTCAVPV